jgi:tripartite-type tricarboxylate transporter receptor subunit TctC
MELTRRRALALGSGVAAAAALGAASRPSTAQPGRPVSIVVAYPAGGDTDALARIYAEKLGPRLGRPMVVDNRSGASGAVGSIFVARAAPTGDTLLLAPSTFPIVPHVLRRGAGYDPVQDFTPVILTGTSPLLLVASLQSGIRSLADLRGQAQAGKVEVYGSPGSGSPMHILGEMFNRAAGLRLAEVAYRGVAPVINDLLAGTIAIGYVTPAAAAQHVKAGTLVPVATSEKERSPILPGVPTFVEAGFAEVEITAWWGVFGPRGLPVATSAALAGHINEILAMPDVREQMTELGAVPGGGNGDRLATVVANDHERFGRLVRELNIQAE